MLHFLPNQVYCADALSRAGIDFSIADDTAGFMIRTQGRIYAMNDSQRERSEKERRVGLCLNCVHSRAITHPRGGDPYWRCGLADTDNHFPKYPRLPVLQCIGYVPEPSR